MQVQINERFRKHFNIQLSGAVLDVGCGDGQYSNQLARELKTGHLLGIDNSPEMINYANEHWTRPNLSFELGNIDEFQQSSAFDFILSFWCLHWTRVEFSFPNMFNALKVDGKLYAVFASFTDSSVHQVLRELAKVERYRELINVDKSTGRYFYRVLNILNKIPFRKFKLELQTQTVRLPELEYFRGLIRILPFMDSVAPELHEDLLDAMLDIFQRICQHKYGGQLYYETRPIFLEAIK
jgi:trans-aconitate methyltransferase